MLHDADERARAHAGEEDDHVHLAALQRFGKCKRLGVRLEGHFAQGRRHQRLAAAVPDKGGNLGSPAAFESEHAQTPEARSDARHQYRRFCCRTMSNVAVSAMAIAAMTPAWIGSDTTRSAASGTLPAMFREITMSPFARTSSTALVMSPPMSEPASTSSRTRGRRATARTAAVSACSPTSGIVSTEMRSPRML